MLQRYGEDARLKVLALVASVGLIIIVLHGVETPHGAQSSGSRSAAEQGGTGSSTSTPTTVPCVGRRECGQQRGRLTGAAHGLRSARVHDGKPPTLRRGSRAELPLLE